MNFSTITHLSNSVPTEFSWLDYLIFAIFLIISLAIGIYFGFCKPENATVSNYLMGGRKMKSFPIAMSVVACNISSVTLLILPVDIYLYGATYVWICVSTVLILVATTYIYLPVFYHLQLTSIYEYLERRFDKRTRLVASLLYICHLLWYLPTIFYTFSLAFSTVIGINYHLISMLLSCFCIFYTAIGGLKSVVWNDVIQMVAIVGSLLIVLVIGIVTVGGPTFVWEKAKTSGRLDVLNFDPNPTKRDTVWSMIIGATVVWFSHTFNQSTIIKFSSVPTFHEAKKAVGIFGVGFALMMGGNILQGLVMYALYSDCDPLSAKKVPRHDGLVSYYVTNMLENITGLSGIFFAGLLSAALSTVSTQLNAISGVIYNDFIVGLLKSEISEAKACTILKIIVIATGVLCTVLIFLIDQMGSMFQFTVTATSLSTGPQLGMFSLGILVPKAHSKGAFYGAICGMISVISLVVPAKYYEGMKLLSYPTKPLSTAGCEFLNDTQIMFAVKNTTITAPPRVPSIFKISFFYYTLIGTGITMILGTVISYLSKNNDPPLDKKLITPLCHSLIPETRKGKESGSLMKSV